MAKNLFLLAVLTWISSSYAAHPVAQESLGDAQAYKVEKPVEEQDAQRSVAGAKIKKNKKKAKANQEEVSNEEADSEVRYWEYSE